MEGRLLRATPMFNPGNIDQYGVALSPARHRVALGWSGMCSPLARHSALAVCLSA